MKRYYFVFCKDELMLERQPDGTYTIPLQEEPPTEVKPWTTIMNITPLDDIEVKAYSIDTPPTSTLSPLTSHLYEMCPLRQSYYKLPHPLYLKAGKCAELLYWDRNTKFCGVCGGHMHFHTDISKRCEMCGKEVWPQLATAVIVLIRKGKDEILLARGRNFRSEFYGLIAGFVETGETLEEAVKREVMEETWPYPSGLMVGFTADYESGEIHVQREELKKAGWFHRTNLPTIPEKLSIARRLIDHWLDEE